MWKIVLQIYKTNKDQMALCIVWVTDLLILSTVIHFLCFFAHGGISALSPQELLQNLSAEDPSICKAVYAETSTQFGWIRGSINLSLIEIAQMEARGSPMLGAVHRGVNYDPVSLCGLVALPRQSLTCSSGVFHFKTTILLRSRSNRAKVRGYCATKWFITTSTARTLPPPPLPLLTQSPCSHIHGHILSKTHLFDCDRVSVHCH